MADDLLKFRCYQCNKLLGAPARKAGKTIACPNCKADLIVPEPAAEPDLEDAIRALTPKVDEPIRIAEPNKQPGSSASTAPGHDPGFSWEQLDTSIFEPATLLTATDLPNINIDSAPLRPAEYVPIAISDPAPPLDLSPAPPTPAPSPETNPTAFQFDVPDTRTDVLLIPPVKPGSSEAEAARDIPEIAVETPTVSSTSAKSAPNRRRDGNVVLAQSVLVSWSLFVLLALAISFVAGLFVGHFFWKQ